MAVAHAKNHTLLVGEESVFGTPVATTKDLGLVQNFSPTSKRTKQKIYACGSREIQEIVSGNFQIDFDCEVNLQHGRPLYYLFGGVAHALTTSDTKHTFSFGTTVPSLTIEDSYNLTSDAVFNYAGCKVGEATISFEKEGIGKMKFSGQAKTVDTSDTAANSAVISTLPVLSFKQLSVLVGAAGAEASPGKVQSISLTINNGLVRADAAGNFLAQEIIEGNIDLTGEFSMLFESVTEYQRFLGTVSSTSPSSAVTSYSMVINAHNGVTLGSGRREFYAQLDGFEYEEVGKPTNVGEMVVASYKFTATGLGSNGCYFVDSIAQASF